MTPFGVSQALSGMLGGVWELEAFKEFVCKWRKMKFRLQVDSYAKQCQVKWLTCCVCVFETYVSTTGLDKRVYFVWRHILHIVRRTCPLPSQLGRWLPFLLFTAHIRFILTRTIPSQEGAFPFLERWRVWKGPWPQRPWHIDTVTCPPNRFLFVFLSMVSSYIRVFPQSFNRSSSN